MKKLLIGPAGSGKTHRLLDEFEQALHTSADPLEANCFFILPSAEHTERIIQLILVRGHKGFFHRRVTTLSRLISDVFGIGEDRIASSVTRFMLISDILKGNQWDYFSDVQKSPGFISLMTSFLGELKEAPIPPPLFRERMNALKKLEPDLAPKYEALAAIYESYEERLQGEGFYDRQDMLRVFREGKQKGLFRTQHFKKIWLDGFFDFSNLQLEYLRELAETADEMTVTLTRDADERRPDLFESLRETEEAR